MLIHAMLPQNITEVLRIVWFGIHSRPKEEDERYRYYRAEQRDGNGKELAFHSGQLRIAVYKKVLPESILALADYL